MCIVIGNYGLLMIELTKWIVFIVQHGLLERMMSCALGLDEGGAMCIVIGHG